MRFHLKGKVCWSVGSCHDDREQDISKKFNADSIKEAVEKSKKELKKYHEKHSHKTDYGLSAELSVTKLVWETHFEDEEPAQEKISARPATKAIPAHFSEKRVLVKA